MIMIRMLVTGLVLLSLAVCADAAPNQPASQSASQPAPGHIGDVFVIAFENHNLTQPDPKARVHQILGNPAAPYMNSLMTPNTLDSAQVSYAKAYYNAGVGVHDSEANYIWAEAGTNFGVHTDKDPSKASGNWFVGVDHLAAQLDRAGIPWKSYQEDIEFAASPTQSVCQKHKTKNIYNGTPKICYVVKHNPMAFFKDTANENMFSLARLFKDLDDNSVGRYNWITPDLFNEAHSPPSGGFTYHGVHYTGDQAAVASADHFLSVVIPKIMASRAYKSNGVIILWWDETEGGDDVQHTIPEIIISPLAKGNAYASRVPMNHSSDLKTMEEIFRLPALHNPIPKVETRITGKGYNTVESVNDLSDLFLPGVIPSTFGDSGRR